MSFAPVPDNGMTAPGVKRDQALVGRDSTLGVARALYNHPEAVAEQPRPARRGAPIAVIGAGWIGRGDADDRRTQRRRARAKRSSNPATRAAGCAGLYARIVCAPHARTASGAIPARGQPSGLGTRPHRLVPGILVSALPRMPCSLSLALAQLRPYPQLRSDPT